MKNYNELENKEKENTHYIDFLPYTIDDNILPGFHPSPAFGNLWPEGIASRIIDLSTAIVFYSPGILILCTIGNIVSILCLKRLYPSLISTGIYLIIGLLFDTLFVWTRTGFEWIKLAINFNIRDTISSNSLISCKIFTFLMSTILHISSWSLVIIAVETAWIYQHPQKIFYCCNNKRVKLTILIIILFALAINSHCFWTYSIYSSVVQNVDHKQLDITTLTCANELTDERIQSGWDTINIISERNLKTLNNYRRTSFFVLDLLVSDILPYFIIFSCSIILITKRIKRRDQLRLLDNTWKVCNIDSMSARQLQTCFILLCVTHSFFLFPKLVFKTFLLIVDSRITGLVPYMIENKTCTIIARAVCFTLHHLFSSLKVFLFLISSSLFRKECFSLISCYPKEETVEIIEDRNSTGIPLLPNQNHSIQNNKIIDTLKQNIQDNQFKNVKNTDENLIQTCNNSINSILENGSSTIKVFSMTSV